MNVQTERAREQREYKFSEVRHLRQFGANPDEIARRLHTNRHALETLARNWGAADVYEYMRAPRHRAGDSRTCPECAGPMGRGAKTCWDCRWSVKVRAA